jgi:adenosylmethionine-8-amino-7-oxononanoate aminotransferase
MKKSLNQDWLARSQAAVWHPCTQMQHHAQTGSASHLPLVPIARGSGAWLYDFDGKRYLDGISSWWTNLFGHANPRINAALKDQLETLEHVMLAGFTHQPVVELSERLSALTSGSLGHAFYASDGASATEIALKMSFHYWRNLGRPEKADFLCIAGSYHGETVGALAVTDVAIFKDAYAPLVRAAHVVPSPDFRLAESGETPADVARRAAAALENHLEQHGANIAALIVEPLVQGAAGMAMYDPEYLRLARQLCDQYEVHLICDEIAVGCGRTGTFFAHEQAGIRPDLMCLSKGISGGYLPLSIVLSSLHRQPARLPRRAGDTRHFRAGPNCYGQPPKSRKNFRRPRPARRSPASQTSAPARHDCRPRCRNKRSVLLAQVLPRCAGT